MSGLDEDLLAVIERMFCCLFPCTSYSVSDLCLDNLIHKRTLKCGDA